MGNEILETDFIISLGPDCRISHYLRKYNLRYTANPLDWMMNYSLESAMKWFNNGFSDFFLEIEENKNNESNGYRWIMDKNSGAVSLHHFPVDIDLDENQEKFKKIMTRRTKRMEKIIRKNKRILFFSNRNQPKNDFYNFLQNFKELYDKELAYINIKNNEIEKNKYTKIITKDLKFIEYTFNDVHRDGPNKKDNPNFWIGNEEKWDKIMETIRLSPKFKPDSRRIDGKIIR